MKSRSNESWKTIDSHNLLKKYIVTDDSISKSVKAQQEVIFQKEITRHLWNGFSIKDK